MKKQIYTLGILASSQTLFAQSTARASGNMLGTFIFYFAVGFGVVWLLKKLLKKK